MAQSTNTYRQGERLRSLDVLRGIAILGTLGTNIFLFVNATSGYLSTPPWYESVLSQLTNGKFLALLTLMFGIGLTIQHDSAARRNQKWPQVYLWRGVLLFLDGLLHYILVFNYDVLMAYSITGLIVSYILLTTPRVQKAMFVLAAGTHIGFMVLPLMGVRLRFLGSYGLTMDDFRTPANGGTEEPLLNRFEDPNNGAWYRFDGDRLWNETDGKWMDDISMDGTSYLDEVQSRLDNFILGREEAWFILPMAIALFLLGSFFMRSGLFEPRGKRLRAVLLVVGVAAFAWDMLGAINHDFTVPGMFARYGLPVVVSWGLVAGVAEFYLRRKVGWVGERLEDVGRMALSCYVGQNVVCTVLFASWALNAGRFIPDSWGIWKVVTAYVCVSTIIIVFAGVWRKFFDRGPLEWLWNWSYQKLSRLTPSWVAPRPAVQPAGD